MTNARFKDLMVKLMREEPFWSTVSSYVRKQESKNLPTAAVGFDRRSFVLYYNAEFMESLNDVEAMSILKHEFLHILFGHLEDGMMDKARTGDEHKLWNIAYDLAINSFLLDEIPREFMIPAGHRSPAIIIKDKVTGEVIPHADLDPEKMADYDISVSESEAQKGAPCLPGVGQFANMPSHKSGKWYFEALQQDGDNGEAHAKAFQPMDVHGYSEGGDPQDGQSQGKQLSELEKALLSEIRKRILKDSVRKAASSNKGWGSIPEPLKDVLIELSNRTGTVNWKQVLRMFVSTVLSSSHYSTYRKLNRRYPMMAPGMKKEYVAKIAVSVDMSGSVDDDMLALFATELNGLAKNVEFTVIPFDTQVSEEKIFVWKENERFTTIERVLCGGTCFEAPTKYVNDKGTFNGHIILTDMYAPKPGRSRCPRLWVTPESCSPYFETFERVIKIKEEA